MQLCSADSSERRERKREWEVEEGFIGSYMADILLPDDKVRGGKEEARREKSLESGEAGGLWEVASSSITG